MSRLLYIIPENEFELQAIYEIIGKGKQIFLFGMKPLTSVLSVKFLFLVLVGFFFMKTSKLIVI